MLTLKILYIDGTEWVPNVAHIAECGVACIGGNPQPEDPRQASEAVLDLFPGPSRHWKGTIHTRSYASEQWLKALVLSFTDGSHATYIVPQGDTYLLGPNGDTIDRI